MDDFFLGLLRESRRLERGPSIEKYDGGAAGD
jgi:hypothetical protein